MNTTVFVLLVSISGGGWLPTLEFTTEAKCVQATRQIDTNRDRLFPSVNTPRCVKIEK